MQIKKDNYYALIDIGSNTMRLVIYLPNEAGRFREIENVKVVARLRNHLNDEGYLSDEGITILMETLEEFKDVLNIYPLKHFTVVATATVRQAKNSDTIIQMVKEHLGWDMQILSEEEEAFYGYLAIVNSTSLTEGVTVDMGGGSTEVTYFKNRKLIYAHSFPFGTLSLRQLYDDTLSEAANLATVKSYVKKAFHTLDWLKDLSVPIIAIGGSARNVAQIDQIDKDYPMAGLHQYPMLLKDLNRIKDHLLSLSDKKRMKVEGLSKDRSDIILPAIMTFITLYKYTHADRFVLSQKGLRDGINYELLFHKQEEPYSPNVLEDSFQELISDFDLDVRQVFQVQHLTREIFETLLDHKVKGLTKEDWTILRRASYVFNMGDYIDNESSAQHTFYLLSNRTIDGLSHREKLELALVSSFKNKTVFKQFVRPYKSWLTKTERKKMMLLGALLKFTYCLDATKRRAISDVSLTVKKKTIKLTLTHTKNAAPEIYQAEKQKKHLEKALKRTIDLTFVKASKDKE
ncbi:exopolyphosphatase / guanosine-5'-triphosphate,3'-diphosphate pyrophosphatase [Halolactibacillus halophilus]|uniref:Exopolyphosphatase n=1 Tax=Halolactibacillus halophilus TaxID=306540 RepID=A0A1I5N1C6_9BACI|nr:Ppx/GppA family phosphatase [Halolactibacillus halophilus]GEM01095.1 exopolyphosphatase [Halolactibacillus halophilus]SFP15564.1 exopolyphosphatase / guanosine-5'-triphosphate,3'-diphosphate pyrophosphatase [Halolactibacillus halophilus]